MWTCCQSPGSSWCQGQRSRELRGENGERREPSVALRCREQQHQAPAQTVEGGNVAQRSTPKSTGVKNITHNIPWNTCGPQWCYWADLEGKWRPYQVEEASVGRCPFATPLMLGFSTAHKKTYCNLKAFLKRRSGVQSCDRWKPWSGAAFFCCLFTTLAHWAKKMPFSQWL